MGAVGKIPALPSQTLLPLAPSLHVVFFLGCAAGYKRNGINCDVCLADTYNAADDTSTTCTACTSPKTTATNTGQSDCLGKCSSICLNLPVIALY